jgi:hypothetical protein
MLNKVFSNFNNVLYYVNNIFQKNINFSIYIILLLIIISARLINNQQKKK